ncbi:MAG: GNAT family N-acetyltransferase [Aeromonadales bacterium]|nr:GNAT family N-acetyltransferase [Aeromonadales bacterium]
MYKIRPFKEQDQPAVIELVLYTQNVEAKVGLSLGDQPDLGAINASYHDKGGAFWVAENDAGAIIGCIGLMQLSKEVGVLKKFFIAREYRGSSSKVSSALFSALTDYALSQCLTTLILDTPSVAQRSHTFYKRAGFKQISKSDLPVPYHYPDRDSLLFMLRMPRPIV